MKSNFFLFPTLLIAICAQMAIATPPDKPMLSSPMNGTSSVAQKPSLNWYWTYGANSYKVQICENTDWITVIQGRDLSSSVSSWAPTSNLKALTYYYWRVIAYASTTNDDTKEKTISDVWTFTTMGTAPGIPVPTSPANGAIFASTSPQLRWNANGVTQWYKYQISTTTTFSGETQVSSSYVDISGLAASTKYYWRVGAGNSYGFSGYCATQNFTTAAPVPTGHHSDVTCNSNETDCYVSDSKIWPVPQCGNGCWAAATAVLLQCKRGYQDETNVLNQISAAANWDKCTEMPDNIGLFCQCEAGNTDCSKGMKSLLYTLGGIVSIPKMHLDPLTCTVSKVPYPTTDEIMAWIKDKKAFAISLRAGTTSTNGHVHIIYGYDNTDPTDFQLRYIDSRVSRTFAKKSESYLLWKEDTWDDHWIISNSLVPDAPLPVSINASVDITSGPSQFAHPGGSATYSCTYTDRNLPPATASTFSWSLEFDHSGGTYTLASAPNKMGVNNQSTWSVNVGSLPTGYTWALNAEGNVIGRAKVSTVDSDGDLHVGVWDVSYIVPMPAIPSLSLPPNAATNVSWNPTLQWQPAGGAISYRLQICQNLASTSLVLDRAGLTSVLFPLSGLSANAPYYWRVNATNDWGTSQWSEWWGFTTSSTPDPSNLHDNVTFSNRTVSNAQPTVFARNSITVGAVTVQSTGAINFTAGNTVTVDQTLTIDNGARVNVTVDPALPGYQP